MSTEFLAAWNLPGLIELQKNKPAKSSDCAGLRLGGGFRIRTGEWRFCRPLPYHLAKPPKFSAQTPARFNSHRINSLRLDKKKSGRRDSNPRQPPWQGGALPTELLPRSLHLRRQIYRQMLLCQQNFRNLQPIPKSPQNPS